MWTYCPLVDKMTGRAPHCAGKCILHHLADPTVKVINHPGKPTQYTSHAEASTGRHVPWISGLLDKAYVPEHSTPRTLHIINTNM